VHLWRREEIPLLKAVRDQALLALDGWVQASGVSSGRIFRALNKDGQLAGRVKTKGGGWADGNLTPQAIYYVVEEYAKLAAILIGRERLI
jgi:hypothetical protein